MRIISVFSNKLPNLNLLPLPLPPRCFLCSEEGKNNTICRKKKRKRTGNLNCKSVFSQCVFVGGGDFYARASKKTLYTFILIIRVGNYYFAKCEKCTTRENRKVGAKCSPNERKKKGFFLGGALTLQRRKLSSK